MISIQELGLEILGNKPRSLYILGGAEYGVKEKYIDNLKAYYGTYVTSNSFDEVIQQMRRKHVIPLSPMLYIVRYDEKFVSDIGDAYAGLISKAKICGTIVCVYEGDKIISKFDKYLPNNTASIDSVSPKFIKKYLHQDFPKLDDRCIDIAVKYSTSYGHARTVCKSMCNADPERLARTPEASVAAMFGCYDTSTESEIQVGVASRDFVKLVNSLDKYQDDPDRVVYAVLQTMIELDKIKSSKYSDSPLKDFAKYWTPEDIYYMFMNAYDELNKLRSMSSYNIQDSLLYLFGLLKFQRIPSPEVMNQ